MDTIYPYAQIVHLFCAVIFVGYLFFDVVILKMAKKRLDSQTFTKAKDAIYKVEVKIMPFCFFILFLTGGMMMSRWVNSDMGYFSNSLQQIFMVKVILGFLIFFAISINLIFKFILKKPSPLGNIHTFALVASFIAIFIAKYMFMI